MAMFVSPGFVFVEKKRYGFIYNNIGCNEFILLVSAGCWAHVLTGDQVLVRQGA